MIFTPDDLKYMDMQNGEYREKYSGAPIQKQICVFSDMILRSRMSIEDEQVMIAGNGEHSSMYAMLHKMSCWVEAEPNILAAERLGFIYMYCRHVLEGEWEAAEHILKHKSQTWYDVYCSVKSTVWGNPPIISDKLITTREGIV